MFASKLWVLWMSSVFIFLSINRSVNQSFKQSVSLQSSVCQSSVCAYKICYVMFKKKKKHTHTHTHTHAHTHTYLQVFWNEVASLAKPIPTQWHLLMPLGNRPFENTVGAISPFPTVFSTGLNNSLQFSSNFKLSSAKSFNLENLSSGNGLICIFSVKVL